MQIDINNWKKKKKKKKEKKETRRLMNLALFQLIIVLRGGVLVV